MRCFILVLLALTTWDLGSVTLAASLQSPFLSRPIRGGVSEAIYSELVLFAKYSSAVYQFICPRPLGNKLVESVRPRTTRTPQPSSGLMRVDSSRMSSRTRTGSSCVTIPGRKSSSLFVGASSWRTCSQVRSCPPPFNDRVSIYGILLLTDGNLALVPLVSRGVEDNEAHVHAGFLISYNSVRSVVLSAVHEQLKAFPGYVVVLAGMLYYSYETID
jgi:hypothetical protein